MRCNLYTAAILVGIAGVMALGIKQVLHYREMCEQIAIIDKANVFSLETTNVYKDIILDTGCVSKALAKSLGLSELMSPGSQDNLFFGVNWPGVVWSSPITDVNGENGRVVILGVGLTESSLLSTLVEFDARKQVVSWKELNLSGGNLESAFIANDKSGRSVVIKYCGALSSEPRIYKYSILGHSGG